MFIHEHDTSGYKAFHAHMPSGFMEVFIVIGGPQIYLVTGSGWLSRHTSICPIKYSAQRIPSYVRCGTTEHDRSYYVFPVIISVSLPRLSERLSTPRACYENSNAGMPAHTRDFC